MKMNVKDIPVLVSSFADQYLFPKATTWQKITIGAGVFTIKNNLDNILQNPKIKPFLEMSKIVDEKGLIDINYAYEMMKFVYSKSGEFHLGDYVVDEQDIENIYKLMKNMAD